MFLSGLSILKVDSGKITGKEQSKAGSEPCKSIVNCKGLNMILVSSVRYSKEI